MENQLTRTDHGHLGQLLVYASGLEAAVVVWVAPDFRDEHRRALDWLNERTDTGVDFFGIKIGLVQIDPAGPRAPVFEVVSRPNAWQKDVKQTSAAASAGAVVEGTTPINAARQDFFAEVLTDVAAARPAVRTPKRGRGSWLAFASGPFGFWSIGCDRDQRCQVEAYLDMYDKALNKALFDELAAEAGRWDAATGLSLDWQRLEHRRASRIAVQGEPIAYDDVDVRAGARAWAVDVTVRMYDALDETLRERARELRNSSASTEKQSRTAHLAR